MRERKTRRRVRGISGTRCRADSIRRGRAGLLALPALPVEESVVLEALLEHAPGLVVVFDADSTVVGISRVAAEFMQLPPERLLGERLNDRVSAEVRPAFEATLAGETTMTEERIHPGPAGSQFRLRCQWVPLRDGDGCVKAGMVLAEDATVEDLAERLTFVDSVTEMPNHRSFIRELERMRSSVRTRQHESAVVWLHLDHLRDVNHAFGAEAGDALLCLVANRLRGAVRAGDLLARAEGGGFLLLLPRIRSSRHLERLMRRLQRVLSPPFQVAGETVHVTASCGAVAHVGQDDKARQVVAQARSAMCAAREAGGDMLVLSEADPSEEASGRVHLATDIRRGIDDGQFAPHFQPQIRLRDHHVVALEALARWQHPLRGLLSPAEFMPFAEESGLIVPLGQHLLRDACEHLRSWRALTGVMPRLAVNVSARELQRADVCHEIRSATSRAGLAPSSLEVEFTETAVLADPRHAAEVADGLRAAGVIVSLDDFGTGYSSLTHLRELPIDRIKIDRSFTANCLSDRSAAAIVVAVTHLAHDLDLEVVAEGVETQAQLDFVTAVGCDAAQGYHFARPLPADACGDYLLRAAQRAVPRESSRDRAERSASLGDRG